MYNHVAVIGIGGFGYHVVESLARYDYTILAIDLSQANLDRIAHIADRVVIMDSTDEEALGEINWKDIDFAIVAIGDPHLESSILTVALLKQFGVRRIIGRASTRLHTRTLLQVGADEIVNPEKDMAGMLVNRLAMPNVIDMRYFDNDNVISEFIPPANFSGKTIKELNLRKLYNISIVAIKRYMAGETPLMTPMIIANPAPDEIIGNEDVLVAIGDKKDFEKIK